MAGTMSVRLLVIGAGSGAGNNLIRSLRAGNPRFVVVGCHDDRFVLKKSTADRNYLVPSATRLGFTAALRRVVEAERIDLVIPNTDVDVRMVSLFRRRLPCRVFVPRHRVIELCQDKYVLTASLRAPAAPV